MNKELSNQEKIIDKLKKMILDKVIELRGININKNGLLYANVYVDGINVNEYLVKNKYIIKEKIRRMTEPNYGTNYGTNYKKIFQDINLSSETTNISSNEVNSIKNNFLPLINVKDVNLNSSSSSIIETDCFLSHNWGENKKNHYLVAKINSELVKRGLKTWFDEDKIEGNIRYKMAEGIDNTKCVIVFITKEYRDKVNGIDMRDNAKYEFTYAVNQHGAQYMVPVIMESEMKEIHKWKGELGAALGSILYVDLSDSQLSEDDLNAKYDELYKKIKHIINKRK